MASSFTLLLIFFKHFKYVGHLCNAKNGLISVFKLFKFAQKLISWIVKICSFILILILLEDAGTISYLMQNAVWCNPHIHHIVTIYCCPKEERGLSKSKKIWYICFSLIFLYLNHTLRIWLKSKFKRSIFFKYKFVLINHKIFMKTNEINYFLTKTLKTRFCEIIFFMAFGVFFTSKNLVLDLHQIKIVWNADLNFFFVKIT